MVAPVHLVNEDDARLGVAMRRRDDAIPNVRRIDHACLRRLFTRAIEEISFNECLFVAERNGRTICAAIDGIRAVLDGIEDRLVPRLAIKAQLIPLAVIHRLEEAVGYGHGDVEVRQ